MTGFLIFVVLYFLAGLALAALFKVSPIRMFQAGVFTMLVGLVYVMTMILPDEYRKRIFFDGPKSDEEGSPLVGLFYAIPLSLLICAGVGWIVITLFELIVQ